MCVIEFILFTSFQQQLQIQRVGEMFHAVLDV